MNFTNKATHAGVPESSLAPARHKAWRHPSFAAFLAGDGQGRKHHVGDHPRLVFGAEIGRERRPGIEFITCHD